VIHSEESVSASKYERIKKIAKKTMTKKEIGEEILFYLDDVYYHRNGRMSVKVYSKMEYLCRLLIKGDDNGETSK